MTGYIDPKILQNLPNVDFSFSDAKKSDIVYHLFKNRFQTTSTIIEENYVFSETDRKRPLKVLIHGYQSNVTSPWYTTFKNEYFEKSFHNIIFIDWSIAGSKDWNVASANSKPIGQFIGEFILQSKIPLENVHIIGHSLGSHVAGFIGKHIILKTGKKIYRITATDPGGPGFTNIDSSLRLNYSDAAFTDIIHTDIDYYGIAKPVGHIDFYINGGKNQPGCPSHKEDDNCSHARANMYFAESINSRNVTASSATISEENLITVDKNPEKVVFGDATPLHAEGVYYLETKAVAPFLL